MAKVEIEFTLKNGDKVVTSNQVIIDQLKATGAAYTEVGAAATEAGDEQVTANENVVKSYQEVLAEVKANEKELKALAAQGLENTDRYKQLQEKVAATADSLEDSRRGIAANKSAGDSLIGSLSGVAGGFAAAQGVIGLFSTESENVQKALLKVQSALALAQGVQQLIDAKESFKALGSVAVKAFGSIKAAIAGTGIGLLLIAVPTLIAYWDDLTAALNGTAAAQEKFNKSQEETNKKFAGELADNLRQVTGEFDNYELRLRKISELAGKGDLLFDPSNLKEFVKLFPEANKLTGKEVDYVQQSAKIYERRKQLKKDEVELQNINNALLEKHKTLDETIINLENARFKGNSDLVKTYSDQFDATMRGISALRDRQSVLDTNIIKAQQGIDADLAGIDATSKAKEAADAKAEENRKKREAAVVTDARRRIELIDNELQKRLATLDQQYKEDKKKAKENFESLKLLEQVYLKNRQDALKQFGESYKKETAQIYVDLANITQGDYQLEESLLIESNKKRLQELKSFQEQQIIAVKAAGGDIAAEQEQQRKDTEALTKLGDELILKSRRTALINGYKTLLEAEKSLNKDRLEDIKKTNGITEDLAKINLAVFRLDNAEKVRLEQTAIKSATESDAKAILEKIQNKDVEVSKLTEKQKALYDAYQALRKANEGDEKAMNIAIENFNKEFTDAEVTRVLKFYKDLTDERQKNYENEIAINEKIAALETQNNSDRLSINTAYYKELIQAQNEFGTDYEKFNNYKTLLDKKTARDQINIQLKLVQDKIAIAKADPTSDPQKVKELEAELLKLKSESATAEIDIEKTKAAQKLAVVQKYVEETNKLLGEAGAFIDDLYALEIQKQTQHYDDLLQANEDYYDSLSSQNTEAMLNEINDYSLSQEEKSNIQDEYALREFEIRKKQAEEDKKLEEEKAAELKRLKKEQARIDFAIQIAQIIGNTALAISASIAASPLTFGLPWSAVNAVTGAVQVAAAIAQLAQVESLAQGGILTGKSHAQGGIPIGNTGIEVEGGEAVINKRSTAMYAPLLSAINMAGGGKSLTPNFTGGMATGGQMMFDQNSITQAIQNGMQSGQLAKAYILSSDVQSDIIKNNRIRRQASF